MGVANPSVSVELIENTERLMGLREEWNELLADSSADCLFLTWEWLSTWWRHLSGDRRLFVLMVRSQGRLVAIAPLVVRPPGISRILPFPALEFLGTGSAGSDYLDLIIRRGMEEPVLSALSEHLCGKKLIAKLAQLKKGSSKAEVTLARRLRREGLKRREK